MENQPVKTAQDSTDVLLVFRDKLVHGVLLVRVSLLIGTNNDTPHQRTPFWLRLCRARP
jgi:hypothetical protein